MTDTRAAFEAWAFDLGICVDEWPSLRLAWMAATRHERSECAKVCEDEKVEADVTGTSEDAAYNMATDHCAAAIRARS